MDRFVLQDIKFADADKMTKEESRKLFLEGTKESKEKLFKGNIRLVKFVLNRFSDSITESNYDDLYQVGAIALYDAICGFNLDYNLEFSTYAVPVIEGYIKKHIRENLPLIRPPKSALDLKYKAGILKELYEKKHGEELSVSKLAKLLNVSEFDVSIALQNGKVCSLYKKVIGYDSDPVLVEDLIDDGKNEIASIEIKLIIEKVLSKFNDGAKEAIKLCYGESKTQSEAAEILGVSQGYISKVLSKFKKELSQELDYNPKFLKQSKKEDSKQTIYEKVKYYDASMIDETSNEFFSEKEQEILLHYYPKSGKNLSSSKERFSDDTPLGIQYSLLSKLIFEMAKKKIEQKHN